MFCPKCGTKSPEGARFCAKCSEPLAVRAATAPAAGPSAGGFCAEGPSVSSQPFGPPQADQRLGARPSAAQPAASSPFDCPSDGIGVARLRQRMPQTVSAAVMLVSYFLPIVNIALLGLTITVSPAELTFGKQILGTAISDFASILFIVPGVCALMVLIMLKGRAASSASIIIGAIAVGLTLLCVKHVPSNEFIKVSMGIGFYLSLLASVALIAISAYELHRSGQRTR